MNKTLRLDEIKILQHVYNPYTDSYFTTFLFYIPKLLLAQFNTHRQLVRGVASSRAINLKMFRDDVVENPYIPTFTSNKKGMQGGLLSVLDTELAKHCVTWLRHFSLKAHELLESRGVHKQQANRYLEAFKVVPVVASGTEWQHFFDLRANEAADPDIAQIAYRMKHLYEVTEPTSIATSSNQVFTPFYPGEVSATAQKLKTSTARIARVSFDNLQLDDEEANIKLFNKLAKMRHSTPFEHSVVALSNKFGEFSAINGEGVFALPPELCGHLFTYRDRVVYTRQYKGFYTLRSFMEDFPDVPIEAFTGEA